MTEMNRRELLMNGGLAAISQLLRTGLAQILIHPSLIGELKSPPPDPRSLPMEVEFTGMRAMEMPPVNSPIFGRISTHIRLGGHDVTDYDWEQYMTFMDRNLQVAFQLQPDLLMYLTERERSWRRGPGSNRRIKVLQTSPLPLGYRASQGLRFHAHPAE
jgi:hypothetical protein